jgi:hypothetical protein
VVNLVVNGLVDYYFVDNYKTSINAIVDCKRIYINNSMSFLTTKSNGPQKIRIFGVFYNFCLAKDSCNMVSIQALGIICAKYPLLHPIHIDHIQPQRV